VTAVTAFAGRRTLGRARGSRVMLRLRGLPRGTVTVRLKVSVRLAGKTLRTTLTRRYRTCGPVSRR
jgi:hypothetical protein